VKGIVHPMRRAVLGIIENLKKAGGRALSSLHRTDAAWLTGQSLQSSIPSESMWMPRWNMRWPDDSHFAIGEKRKKPGNF